MDAREEKVIIEGMLDIAGRPLPLVIGIDKWMLESLVPRPFLWLAEPFEGTRAAGFIKPGTRLREDFPLLLLVALDDAPPRDELFLLRHIVFHASEWHRHAAIAATRASDIVLVKRSQADVVKSNWRLVPFASHEEERW